MRIELQSFRTRAARRLFLVFVACAIVPVLAAGLLAYRELSRQLRSGSQERMGDFSANYGLSLIDRLREADSMLRSLSPSRQSRGEALQQLRGTGLFADVHTVSGRDLTRHLTSASERDGTTSVTLFRPLAASVGEPEALAARLQPLWLWGNDEDLPHDVDLVVLSDDGGLLHASSLPPAVVSALRHDLARMPTAGASRDWRSADGAWQGRAWLAPLGAQFDARSWTIVALQPTPSVFNSAAPLTALFPLLLAASAVCAALLSIWQIRRQLRPMESLLDGTRRLARRDFTAQVAVEADDEFGELAGSFNSMAASLRRQFDALQAAAAVDRLLLQSTDLEQVLDQLLPRLAALLGCSTVSVLLLDRDAPDQARLYDFAANEPGAVALRRVVANMALLQSGAQADGVVHIDDTVPPAAGFLHGLRAHGARHFELWPLRQNGEAGGLLCLGFAQASDCNPETRDNARGFADRLAVVLANVAYDQRLYHQAHFDSLTELPNRQLFRERLAAQLTPEALAAGGALLYIDLDHFKRVNDTAGHSAGDELLKIVARRIGSVIKSGDTAARLGGDEFAVVLTGLRSPHAASEVAGRIIEALQLPIDIDTRTFRVGASVGITLFPQDGQTLEELLKNGDLAMYRAKEQGRNRAVFFEPELQARVSAHAARIAALHQAVREQQFELHYQPIITAASGRPGGAEALMRWYADGKQYCGPDDFIPVAEETGLIVEMGRWALQESCRQLAVWREQGRALSYISVNVSARQLHDENFVALVAELLRSYELPPSALQLEIVERVIAEGPAVERVLKRLAAMGVRLALDDFGTGYSSLSYLRAFPIHCVKIDRSFVCDVTDNHEAATLVETIIAMAHSLHKTVVAEGVESQAQADFLVSRGCDALQGYRFSRPLPAREFAALLPATMATESEQQYA